MSNAKRNNAIFKFKLSVRLILKSGISLIKMSRKKIYFRWFQTSVLLGLIWLLTNVAVSIQKKNAWDSRKNKEKDKSVNNSSSKKKRVSFRTASLHKVLSLFSTQILNGVDCRKSSLYSWIRSVLQFVSRSYVFRSRLSHGEIASLTVYFYYFEPVAGKIGGVYSTPGLDYNA